ncbi:MAG: Nucleoside triphosphate pyrophosphohydrolase/pyrophosphatase MazG [Candidatus Moanabacter tarae]|uniref:Nucleoside triphosphate pyrophosphohydrolase/pyrophosphatase MazG n=1 Tax=Candidatus Moanibacter tarae TaxID=2200854 RepID=A0A2Z4APE0_9BACT|nr:MAG: Nucleoside triphosphate pyrophosphohydrolase/pyrophosphatase MazG [Candidatus Moanabacter tarae]|tara:strand:- start:6380 stop:7039 length:660 start_codon:yes stop_codon:yes gene_type:complete
MTGSGTLIQELKKTVATLRGPNGCPWDREQTHESLAECLIEECAELLDTIDRNDMMHMREELGDVLLQVVMHAQLAQEKCSFDLDAIIHEVNEKLIRRHPHVFGPKGVSNAEEALNKWDEIKALERGREVDYRDKLSNLPKQLPALLYARDVCKLIKKGGIENGGLVDAEEAPIVSGDIDEEEAGKILFQLVKLCYDAEIDPESALRRYTSELVKRVKT